MGILFCSGLLGPLPSHPAKPGEVLSKNLFTCRLNLPTAHWHPVVEFDDGHAEILWDVEVFDEE